MAEPFFSFAYSWWFYQSSLVVDNWLYISGGEIWALWEDGATVSSPRWNDQVFAVDLSKPWMPKNVTAVKTNLTNHNSAIYDQQPSRRPQLWYDPDQNEVWSLGGELYNRNGSNTSVTSSIPFAYTFTPSRDGHANFTQRGQGFGGQPRRNIGGASTANSAKVHYSLGGYYDYIAPDGNVRQSASDVFYSLQSGTWTNITTPAPLSPYNLFGEAQYIPIYGQEGIIVFMGGRSPSSTTIEQTSSLKDFSTISIYDIHSQTFYQQAATNAPPAAYSFCSVSAGAADNSSYEIYIYGGTQGANTSFTATQALSSVWVLTLPSFNWLEVPNSWATSRVYHTCALLDNHQMVSIGGLDGLNLPDFASNFDFFDSGLNLFDLNTMNWTGKYTPSSKPYVPADLIKNYYSTNATYPTWSNSALGSLFENKRSNATSTNGTSSSNSGSGATTAVTNSKSIGAIVGGVIGGLAVIALIAFVIWFLRRKKRTSTEFKSNGSAGESVQYQEVSGDNEQQRQEMETKQHMIPQEMSSPEYVYEMPGRGDNVAYEMDAGNIYTPVGEAEVQK